MGKGVSKPKKETQKIPTEADKNGAFVVHYYKQKPSSGNRNYKGKIQQNPLKIKANNRKKNKVARKSRRINKKAA